MLPKYSGLLLAALLLTAVAAHGSKRTRSSSSSRSTRQVQGVGPFSYDYLLGANKYSKTNAAVVFLDYDLEKSIIQRYLADGKTVICYVNIGAWEDWRDDAKKFPASVLGKDYDGWPGEKWLDIRQIEILRPIMKARFERARSKGCQGIDPDNMNGWSVTTGFKITKSDQLKFNKAMATEIKSAGMLAGMKNDNEQAADLVQSFDFAVLESCAFYDECHYFDIFIQNKKPVYAIEYTDNWTAQKFTKDVCPLVKKSGMSFILKKLDLGNDYLKTCPT